ncbi:phosphatidylinositol transfer protein SFH5 [Coccidioides immitis RS]|uniref:Phosphatidylinositol transfer protein SFH5 n=2 Tax=Coccidioides immitis TaxID=5501 RepID=SFH5_COCIM|nr:phosphatidylinositol transfer protein SFH5 [Coccidioides immitis RS]Q1DSY1.1 RecName: Full=Phosphatidylinositol transfer protein SFH5; Short=PITP SFH5 [Coccidioides immitis RS]EAS31103.1 phosphatidylinositol transfer protein SFH5 [Coccidioides immitis RS]KMU83208.1 hypothetical protein CIHG_00990 [Coccidioides immitis H538.4]TPX23955.1 Non-classical phosphatidylinositol transfer protein (PITP) [Coccidioides immitis]
MEKVQEQPAQTLSETAEQPAERVVEQPQDSAATAAPPGDSKEAETEKPAEVAPKEDSKEAPAPPPAATTAATADDANSDIIEEVKDKAGANTQVADPKPQEPADTRPSYLVNNAALSQFFDRLAPIVEKAGHNEMWGVPLKDAQDAPTVNIMIKFLRANEGNVKLAEEQLVKALEWRKKMNPLALAESAAFPSSKFKGLGYITTYRDPTTEKNVVFTWNIYGSVKNVDLTFGNLEEFIKWRVALMELAIRELRLESATSVMDYNGEDPYQMIQVHDYQNVSFIRMNPNIRAASRETIEVFSTAYPELLKEKYFVNLPVVMGWVFTALKVFLSKNTIRKFHPITNGVNLAREFTTFGEEIPKTYGGKGDVLADSGRTVTLQDDKAPETKPEENGNASQAPEAEPASGNPAQTDATNGPAKDDAPKNDKPAVPTDTKTDAPADAPANTLADAPADSRPN